MKIRWAVFASGRGSNFENVLSFENQLQNQSVVCFHADRECRALELATSASKDVLLLKPSSAQFAATLIKFLELHQVNAIFMLGYMRILKPDFLNQWSRGIVNLHPSLLPEFRGKDAIRQAFEAQAEWVGVSIHRVVEAVDAGEILSQRKLKRNVAEGLEALETRVHALEHQMVRDFFFDLDRDESLRLALIQK